MSEWYVLDKDNNIKEATIEEWIEWRDKNNVHVGDTTIGDYRVSTVFLGLDHSFDGGLPVVFETMVFPTGSWSEDYCERYHTYEEALAGHERVVELYKGKVENYDPA